ncbi:hypothetical protein DFJ77DRAFT_89477 [Powellomyces hirtus]|nr:hypothetical protein DFJ77DRAFT_89477 [Powellomyces hirtus]
MDRFGLESVVRVACEVIPKARRFTTLSDLELTCLWKDVVGYLETSLVGKGNRHQSLLLPGFGTFYVRKTSKRDDSPPYTPYFVPSRGWGKVPGYANKPVPCVLDGAMPSDPFNFSAVACQSGCSRETVELGLKDLTHAVLRVVKRGATVVLPLHGVGRLKFANGSIAFAFSAEFLGKLNAKNDAHSSAHMVDKEKPGTEKNAQSSVTGGSISKPFTPETPLTIEPPHAEKAVPQQQQPKADPTKADAAKSDDKPTATDGTPLQPAANAEPKGCQDQTPAETKEDSAAAVSGPNGTSQEPAAAPPTQERPQQRPLSAPSPGASRVPTALNSNDTFPLGPGSKLLYIGKQDPYSLEFTIGTVGTHSHTHSGDRQWNDLQCPICRNAKMPALELRHHRARKEKEQDRLLLQLSLDLDQEYLLRAKTKERQKMAIAMNDAEYNRAKAADNEVLRRKPAVAPVGNMFDDREPGPDPVIAGQELARGLQEQIAARQIRKAQERLQTKYENSVMSQRLTEDLKKAELESHIEKLRKRTLQTTMLSEQIRLHKAAAAAAPEDPHNINNHPNNNTNGSNPNPPLQPNPFTRSENLMLLYQKQKAKQLYAEQLAIVRQKQEHQQKLAEMERVAAVRNLEVSAQELSYDLRTMARQKHETRRALEHQWDQQIALKKRLRGGQQAAIC